MPKPVEVFSGHNLAERARREGLDDLAEVLHSGRSVDAMLDAIRQRQAAEREAQPRFDIKQEDGGVATVGLDHFVNEIARHKAYPESRAAAPPEALSELKEDKALVAKYLAGDKEAATRFEAAIRRAAS